MADLDATRDAARRLMDALGRELLGEPLGARGWTFGFDRARRRLGVCRIADKRITLSRALTLRLPPADVDDTLRHEIAHAIDAERRGRSGHDATWRALAVACGARPERCYHGPTPDDPTSAYAAACLRCGAASPLYRQPVRARRCTACARAGHTSVLRVTRRADGRVIWPGGDTPGVYGGTAGVRAACPGCGAVTRRARRPRRALACAACCDAHAGGRYDRRFRLRFG